MVRATQEKTVETWEITHDGTVWVAVYDKREDKYKKQRVGGRAGGSKRLHITADDRRFNQEQVVDEMKQNDPFTNGSLKLISADRPEDVDTTYHLTAVDLEAILKEDPETFEARVGDIKSELIVRRLLEVAEKAGTVAQLAFIRDLVEERYKVGGTQKSVREMLKAGEELSGTQMS